MLASALSDFGFKINLRDGVTTQMDFEDGALNTSECYVASKGKQQANYGWWEIEEKTQLARKKGYNIWSTWYPYDAGSGNAGATILAPET